MGFFFLCVCVCVHGYKGIEFFFTNDVKISTVSVLFIFFFFWGGGGGAFMDIKE